MISDVIVRGGCRCGRNELSDPKDIEGAGSDIVGETSTKL